VQATKAQALVFAMMDSPVGMAAWILEKFAAWSDLPGTVQGRPDLSAKYSFDQLLTNIMFYVATDSFATASWMYYALLYSEDTRHFPPGRRGETPIAVAAFPDPFLFPPPRSLAEKAYNIVRWRTRNCCWPICAPSSVPAALHDWSTRRHSDAMARRFTDIHFGRFPHWDSQIFSNWKRAGE
jgi:hypothetical protein